MKDKRLPAEFLRRFINEVLVKARVRSDVAAYVTEGLVQTSLRGVDSHGVRLIPHYLEGVKKGRINPDPKYVFKDTSASTCILDADNTFGHAAGMEAAKKAVKLAQEAGTGHVAVCNSSHFGAAAYYALEIARHDMIGMSFTNTDALVRTHAGKKAFLGNNPICFAAPCKEENPFCLDMATSVLSFNKIKQLAECKCDVPPGVGADENGVETIDPMKVVSLMPIGAYKGYGLSLAIEILCSLLTGMPYGPHIPKMFKAPMSQKRNLGQYFIAMRIDCFQDKEVFKERLSEMINEIRNQPRMSENVPIQVAGDPENSAYADRVKNGIPLSPVEYEKFFTVSSEYDVPFVSAKQVN